jgi:CubicO group peptidase (beta-lactamase class C family)
VSAAALADAVDEVARATGFTGVVRVDRPDQPVFTRAFGDADRRHGIPNTPETQFAIASGSKGFTALAVVSLIEDGRLELETPVRSVLGDDLPLIDAAVTVEHLLAHRSGIGDYLDEEDGSNIDDLVLPVPASDLVMTEQYLSVLDGHPMHFTPGERFSYCNSGFVVLALIAERVSGIEFHQLVSERVCSPAGMRDTEFLRSDELPGRAAVGYVAGGTRSNVFHLPARGSGDGGAYSTASDLRRFWDALFAGRVVDRDLVAVVVQPRSDPPEHGFRYGLGFWLHQTSAAVLLEGYDAGVSFRSVHDPETATTHTVIANTSEGAWPMTRRLTDLLER